MKNNSLFSFFWKETKQYRLRIIAFEIFVLVCGGIIPMFIQPAIFGSFLNSMANKTLTINNAIFLSFLYQQNYAGFCSLKSSYGMVVF